MLLAPGQRAQVSDGGLEFDWITGVNAERCDCVPEPAPGDIPPVGEAEPMPFGDTVPGRGIPYMLGVSVSDRYLDNLLYHAWRSGLLCLDYVYDDYKYDWLNSKALEIFIPSLAALSDGEALPGKLTLRAEKVPEVRIGAGGFPAESGQAAPQLQAFFRDVHMALWLQFQGRWVRILVLTQDIQIDLGLDLTPENQIIPVLADEGISVSSIRITDNEFLDEEDLLLQELVPYLASIVIPKFADLLEKLAIPQFFGFTLNVKSVQGDVQLPESDFHRFLSVYADLRFAPPPQGIETRVRLIDIGPDGFEIEVPNPGHEIQYRIDDGIWSPFQSGPRLVVRQMLLPGPHRIEVRARRKGDYLTLDASAEQLLVYTTGLPLRLSQPVGNAQIVDAFPAAHPESRIGCATSGDGRPGLFLLILLGLAWLGRRPH
jgi:MYXO-CTERM domain-containing protein